MWLKDLVKRLMIRCARLAAEQGESGLRDFRNVELVLATALRHTNESSIHYPAAYIDLLRSCIEHSSHTVVEIKSQGGAPEFAAKRFETFIEQLRRGLPEVEFSVAREIALAADANRFNGCAWQDQSTAWAADVGLHFSISSALGRKLRILFNVVRFSRSEQCLELGTAYGMSALFILAALQLHGNRGHLNTVEGFEPQFSIASSVLKQRYPEMVSCHFGLTGKVLPQLVQEIRPIDFMFHDAGHTREDYINDFNQASPALAPGAVVLIDDIRWEGLWRSERALDTYAGWKEVVNHSRVCRAVEIDGDLGCLLLR